MTIPVEPERITALGSWDLDLVVSLGLAPVAALLPFPPFAWLKDHPAIAGLTVMQGGIPGAEFPIEQIAATRPDLIADVAGTFSGSPYGGSNQYARLSEIAPTLSAPTDPVMDGWRARLRHLGTALAKEAQAEAAIAATEDALATVRHEHPEFAGRTATYALVSGPEQVQLVIGEQDFSRQFLAELGFRAPPAQVDALRTGPNLAGATMPISLERLHLLDADVIIFGLNSERLLAAQPAYQSLEAVKRGRVLSLDTDASFTIRVPSPLNIPHFIQTVVPQIAAALAQ